ncbi:hypothetical protein [Pseudoalteromonas sp. GB56]
MSVLNKTLKAIEQRDNTAELGLEPTVELNKSRELPKSLMYVIVIGLACALVGAAYLFIPKRPVSVPMTPALVHDAELSQQAKQQPDKPAQPLTGEDQKHVVTVNAAAQQQVELSDEATIVQQPSTATLPAQQMIADDVITANEAQTSAILTAPQSPPNRL